MATPLNRSFHSLLGSYKLGASDKVLKIKLEICRNQYITSGMCSLHDLDFFSYIEMMLPKSYNERKNFITKINELNDLDENLKKKEIVFN